MLFASAGVTVLADASPEVLGLADVDDLACLVEHPVDAGQGGERLEEIGSELSVEGLHASLSITLAALENTYRPIVHMVPVVGALDGALDRPVACEGGEIPFDP